MALNRSKKRRDDPTGQATRRTAATRTVDARLRSAEKRIKAIVRQIPSVRRTVSPLPNQETIFYDYRLTPAQRIDLNRQITAILTDELETLSDAPPPGWFWIDQVETPFRQGTLEEINRFNQLLAAAIVAGLITDPFVTTLTPEQVLNSTEYQTALRQLIVRDYGDIKTLSQRTSSQVIRQIGDDMAGGLGPRAVAANISERFGVSQSSAKRIADTEINRVYNDAKLNSAAIMEARTNQRTGVLHISALLPTTREHHAARHGNVYTVEDQNRWWDEGANRINCFIQGTKVSGRFVGGLKSFYRGKVIKLVTGNGRDLTVTPNHKVMTDRGLVAAAKIMKGDNLVAYRPNAEITPGIANLDVHQADTRIEDVFAALLKVGHSSVIGPINVDLDSDQRFLDEDIYCVFTDLPLIVGRDSGLFQALDDLRLKHPDPAPVASSAFFQTVKSVLLSTPRFDSFSNHSLSLFFRHIFGTQYAGISLASGMDAVLPENPIDNGPGDIKRRRQGLNCLPGNMFLDNVTDVIGCDFSGHVYDLQEVSGLIIANGITSSNCKCSISTVLINDDDSVMQVEDQQTLRRERRFFERR